MEMKADIMTPRLAGITGEFLARQRTSVEEQLTVDLENLPKAPPTRRMYAWDAVANDYRQLMPVAYAAGEPLEQCRRLLTECAKAYLEVVKLRGNGSQPSEDWMPPKEYATGNSRSTFVAIYM